MRQFCRCFSPATYPVLFKFAALSERLLKIMTPEQPPRWPILAFFLVIFGLSPAVWAGTCRIEAGRDWIAGKADTVPLGQVLTLLSEKTGAAIFVDEELVNEPVSFGITGKMETEDALRRIIHPHSYAAVYGKRPDQTGFDILEVRIYPQGRQSGGRYVPLYPAAGSARRAATAYGTPGNRGASGPPNASSFGSGNRPGGIAAVSKSASNSGAIIRARYGAQKGAFGQSLLTAGKTAKAPDYRPSASEMQQAYAAFKQDQKDYLRRAADSRSRQSQSKLLQNQGSYRNQRNLALKKNIVNH